MDGKERRLGRILENGKAVIVPMDHGTSAGPMQGLEDMNAIVEKVERGGASAVLLHKGIVRAIRPPRCGVILHLNAGTILAPDPNRKTLVARVEEAVRLGCDAVSVHVNIGGSDSENEMLGLLGSVAEECERLQMPLLAMMYARGKNVKAPHDPESIALVARVAAELGADIVKCPYTGDADTFRRVVRGCPVPIVIAGGPRMDSDRAVLEMTKGAMEAGAIGVSIGRNVFQHANPTVMTRALRAIIVEKASVEEALQMVSECKS